MAYLIKINKKIRTDGRTNKRKNGHMDKRTDGRTDGRSNYIMPQILFGGIKTPYSTICQVVVGSDVPVLNTHQQLGTNRMSAKLEDYMHRMHSSASPYRQPCSDFRGVVNPEPAKLIVC